MDLSFVENENFKIDNGKYKLVYYLVGKFDQLKIDEFKGAIEKVENELNLKNKIEMNILYAEDFLSSAQLETIKSNKEPLVKFVKCSWEELQKDRNSIMTYFYLNFILLSPENTIIHRNASIQSFPHFIQQYIDSQNQPTSQAGNSRLLLIIVVSLILSGMLSWFVIRIRTAQIQKRETARRKVSELELTAIRSQMNPHFIFNAMGSIQNLINQNKVKNANLYLASFARLMRMVLANSNKKLVSMAHELELIETYLQLEQLRVDFNYRISVAENIDPEVEELPGMLIQPFVENAVIHGITQKGTGNIEVAFSKKENTLICEIIDDGVGIDTDKPGNGNGVAMKLSEKRLDLLNSQLQDKLKLVVENRMKTEKTSGTRITLYIPVG